MKKQSKLLRYQQPLFYDDWLKVCKKKYISKEFGISPSKFQYWCLSYLILSKCMHLFNKQLRIITNVFPFAKNATPFSYESAANRRQSSKNTPMKDYEKLFTGNQIVQMPKLPSMKFLNNMRPKQIAKIMIYNHELNHEEVFQSHIECFYSLTTRYQPSVQGMSLLLQQIYKRLVSLNSQFPQVRLQAQNSALTVAMKPSILKKLVYIIQAIESYYNEYLKMMLATFFTRSILFSQSKQIKKRQELLKLQKLQQQVLKKGKQLFDEQGIKITPDRLNQYFQNKKNEIESQYPTLTLGDFLESSLYVISNQYYSDNLLQAIVSRLESQGLNDKDDLLLSIGKIKLLGSLHKFQHFKSIQAKKTELFDTIYNENVERYFHILQDKSKFFQILNSDEQIIQSQLVLTQFLTNEHFNRAKDHYLNIFNVMFQTNENGCLLIDVKKIRCVFEIIVIMCSYKDTKKVHQFLQKVEKTIILYPLSRLEKLQTLAQVCQKFGFKSDIIAQKYLNSLFLNKERLEILKGIIPHVHQYTRQMNLARKFITYLQIVNKAPKDQIEIATKLASQLFDPNIWYCLTQSQVNSYSYFNFPSFNSFLYFTKISVNNLTSGYDEKKKIQMMTNKIKLININKKHYQVLNEIQEGMKLTPYKLYHYSFWRHNHHSRLASTLKLALHHYHYLLKKDYQQATSFIQQFLKKSINTTYFYNAFKQSMSYPGVFDLMLELIQVANPKHFPIQFRDLQALKKLYSKNLEKLKKMPENYLSKETEKIKYKLFLDAVQFNKILLPYNQDYYGLTGITANLQCSLLFDSVIRYKEFKQSIRMQVETFCKFRKQNGVEVVLNYLEYPHIADVYIKRKEKVAVILLKLTDNPEYLILHSKQIEMQKTAEQYWRKKGFYVIYLRSKREVQEFADEKIKETFNKLEQQRI